MQVIIDIPLESIDAFRDLIDLYGIEPRDFEMVGPAGGNPRYTLVIPSRSAMVALNDFYWGPA